MSATPDWPARFVIPSAKITAYLLAPGHPRGGPKARFFIDRGFAPSRPNELAVALLSTASRDNLVRLEQTAYGLKLTFVGAIEAPAGSARVRTVWILAPDTTTAAFVTAVPD